MTSRFYISLVAFFTVPGLTRAKLGMYLVVHFYYPGKKNFAFFFAPGFNRLNKFLPQKKVWTTAAAVLHSGGSP